MLCQLVCTDRRYQRMNCFSIREIQSILKRKFFTDLINTHDHKTLLDKTAMGLRFKTNNINSINSNIFNFYNYGIEFSPKIRAFNGFLDNTQKSNFLFIQSNSLFFSFIDFFKNNSIFIINNLNNLYLSNNNTFYLLNLNLNLKSIVFEMYNLFFEIINSYNSLTQLIYSESIKITSAIINFYQIFSCNASDLKFG